MNFKNNANSYIKEIKSSFTTLLNVFKANSDMDYKINDKITINKVEYLITENLKCDFDELMLIEIGVN